MLRGEALEHVSGRLQQQLAEALLSNPPYELRWMKDHPRKVSEEEEEEEEGVTA